MIKAWDIVWFWIALMAMILLLSGCARGAGSYTYCIGACGEIKAEKDESPIKPQDWGKGKEDGT